MHIARRGIGRQHQGQARQLRVVARCQVLAALQELRQALQLHQAQGGGGVGQVVFKAGGHHLVVPGGRLGGEAVERVAAHAVQTHHAHALGQFRVARDGHAALARGDGLVGVEAEHRHVGFELSHQPALPGGGQGVRGVFHHFQAMRARNGQNGVHVAGQAPVVHRQDGLGPGRDGGADGLGGDVQRDRVHVHQHRVGTQVAHHLHGGGEGQRGRDHLVARADPQGLQREVQAGGGGVDGDALQPLAAQVVGEGLLEGTGFGAGGDPA